MDKPELAAAMNGFAVDLWQAAVEHRGNALVSPGSVWLTLAMAASGARGRTRDELVTALHLGDGLDEAVSRQLGLWNLNFADAELRLSVLNRLFADEATHFDEGWLKHLEKTWHALAPRLPFRTAPEPARTTINEWVASQTSDHIRDLLPPGAVDQSSRLVLVNAVYFEAGWASKFIPELTVSRPFFTDTGAEVTAPFMYQQKRFGYLATSTAQVLELPYVGTSLTMVVVLPRERDGLPALERTLSAQQLDVWFSELKRTLIDLQLPSFTVVPEESIRLRPALEKLGVVGAFEETQADFRGMADPVDPADRLFLSEVFHQAQIRVNEAGTQASAATAAVMTRSLAAPNKVEPVPFYADHPFLFVLRDSDSGAWLFVGRLASPV